MQTIEYSPVVRQLADRKLYTTEMWFVYALYNHTSKKIYIGETEDIQRRVLEHNSKLGNHFTAKYDGEWEVIYQEQVSTRTQALVREKQLKSFRGREFLKQYIPL